MFGDLIDKGMETFGIKFHGFEELEELLESTSFENRNNLRDIIKPPYCNEHDPKPRKLCDHLNHLRLGLWSATSQPSYKQLVTDIADSIGINWDSLYHKHFDKHRWEDLSSKDIEDAIVEHVSSNEVNISSSGYHIKPEIRDAVTDVLVAFVKFFDPGEMGPIVVAGKPIIRNLIGAINYLPKTEWRTLLAAVIYINQFIR